MDKDKKGLAILGSTGRVGQMALNMLRQYPHDYQIEVLTAQNNKELLIEQALEFKPNVVVVENESFRAEVDEKLWEEDIKTYAGSEAIFQVAEMNEIQVVLNGIKGIAGIKPSMMAAISNKNLILGNTESINVKSEELFEELVKRGTRLFSIDPIHSAVFQLLKGEEENKIKSLSLTINPNDELRNEIKSLFDIAHIEFLSTSEKNQAIIEFEDGCKKSISGISEEQALANALFYPKRIRL